MDEHFDIDRLSEFWHFVYDRHMIYVRRFEQELPRELWTNDPVLQTVFFTNVYRELDIGTQYLKDHIIDQGTELDELFEILVYRLFNNRYTYEALSETGRPFGDWKDWREISHCIKERHCRHDDYPIFSMAHMTTSMRQGGQETKVGAACYVLHQHWKNIEDILHMVVNAGHNDNGLENQCKYIATLDGYGMFLSYEIVTDLHYSKGLQRFSPNDWANPGPGCRKAIDTLVPTRKRNKIPYLDVIRFLHQNQEACFDGLHLDFPYYQGERLSLRNVEHSLCEYYKYHRAKHTGYARRKYYG